MKCVYVYRLTSDTGLAPCVDNDLLSLAVCKGGQVRGDKVINTGLRYWIGSKKDVDYTKDEVYLLGTYENKFLYLARVTDVVTIQEYFSSLSKGRTDNIYSVVNGKLKRNSNLVKEDVHMEPGRIIRDFAGEYVILSDDFIYLGRDAAYNERVAKYNAISRETKLYKAAIAEMLIEECRKYADGKKHVSTSPFKKTGGCKCR